MPAPRSTTAQRHGAPLSATPAAAAAANVKGVGWSQIRHDQHEFFAAGTRHQIIGLSELVSKSDSHQYAVTDGMAKHVVHPLEVVRSITATPQRRRRLTAPRRPVRPNACRAHGDR